MTLLDRIKFRFANKNGLINTLVGWLVCCILTMIANVFSAISGDGHTFMSGMIAVCAMSVSSIIPIFIFTNLRKNYVLNNHRTSIVYIIALFVLYCTQAFTITYDYFSGVTGVYISMISMSICFTLSSIIYIIFSFTQYGKVNLYPIGTLIIGIGLTLFFGLGYDTGCNVIAGLPILIILGIAGIAIIVFQKFGIKSKKEYPKSYEEMSDMFKKHFDLVFSHLPASDTYIELREQLESVAETNAKKLIAEGGKTQKQIYDIVIDSLGDYDMLIINDYRWKGYDLIGKGNIYSNIVFACFWFLYSFTVLITSQPKIDENITGASKLCVLLASPVAIFLLTCIWIAIKKLIKKVGAKK